MKKKIKTERKYQLLNELLIIDGQPGCGKTLLSAIVSAFSRVELLQFSTIAENICALNYLEKIEYEDALTFLKIEFDQRIYETMMSRNLNFRIKDLSSAFNNVKRLNYIKRLWDHGDENIPRKIEKESPILHLTTHNLLGVGKKLLENVVNKITWIEVIRHPLYMIVQQTLNWENWSIDKNTARQFHLYINDKNSSVPYYLNCTNIDYSKLKPVEKAIYDIDFFSKKVNNLKKYSHDKTLITIPFEIFVLEPFDYLNQIKKRLCVNETGYFKSVMKKQNIPRRKISDGIPLNIYKRCGWEPPVKTLSEKEELQKRMDFVLKNGASRLWLKTLESLCEQYEKNIWKPE